MLHKVKPEFWKRSAEHRGVDFKSAIHTVFENHLKSRIQRLHFEWTKVH